MKELFISGSTPVDYTLNLSGDFNNLFLKALSQAGYKVGSAATADLFININHNKKSIRKTPRNQKALKVLFRTEPISVFPAQYTVRVENLYDLVITTGRPKRKFGKFLDIHHPYRTLRNPNFPELETTDLNNQQSKNEDDIHTFAHWKRREILLSLIAADKVSSQKENLYELRRKLASDSIENELEIYGTLWNESYLRKIRHRVGVGLHALRYGTLPSLRSLYGGLHRSYPNYKGAPQDKQEIVRNSKFSLIVENSSTYVSEKLFDAFIGGSIPIYFGPELSKFGIPEKNLVIRHLGSSSELTTRLSTMSESEILMRLDTIKQFVESEYFFKEWDAQSVFLEVVSEITEIQEQR
jgi:hypothetical protein